ncbi:hypothetical protein O6H91_14G049600 [Diphasiastrum complanatum]|uniref:Uncharacterized protein n=2 Tax=Diphasiastrum complanatum TaxID=34168 RepID=A0ACC2BPA7_DIPCM|nr:hypothetical protein O6H91_14G049600 [Diphasiastrum complanatum]
MREREREREREKRDFISHSFVAVECLLCTFHLEAALALHSRAFSVHSCLAFYVTASPSGILLVVKLSRDRVLGMVEDRGAGVGPMLAQLPSTGCQVSSVSFQGVNLAPEGRQRFFVELKEETTIVSWKKLLKTVVPTTAADAPAGANPALEARLAPEVIAGTSTFQKEPLPTPPNRFSSVIEKIERLYKGQDSDDENADVVPDEDQYNTDDSFIDDTELDEYFSVDKAKTKHTGFFINRGKLEKTNERCSSPIVIKKRKPKNVTKPNAESSLEESARLAKVASRIKIAARKLPLVSTPTTGLSERSELLPQGSLTANMEGDDAIGKSSKENNHGSAILQHPRVKDITGNPSLKFTFRRKELLKKTSSSLSGFFKEKGPRKEGSKHKSGNKDRSKLSNFSHEDLRHKAPLTSDDIVSQVLSSQRSNTGKLDANMQTEQIHQGCIPVVTSSKVATAQKPLKGEESKDSEGVFSKSSMALLKSPSPPGKEVSPGKRLGYPKGTVLDRAFQDLQKGVASLCPPTSENQEMEQLSQSSIKSKRLPREVKLKLAKVARLAAKQGKIPDEMVERLMSILGHIMQLKTLKRNLKEMVELGLTAKQEKEGRIEDIKREVTEMVRSRVNTLQAQLEVEQQEASSADDFQLAPGLDKGGTSERYKWDHDTEDRLCDLYEQYLEGMDEHKGPQIRKLYVELAELWPEGWMDNNGIKNAVYRAKERKKKLNRLIRQETRKRKRMGESSLMEENAEDRLAKPLSSFSLIQATLSNRTRVSPTKVAHPSEGLQREPLVSAVSLNKAASFPIKRKYVRKSPGTIMLTPKNENVARETEGKVESSRATYIDPLRKIKKKISKAAKDGSLSPQRRKETQSSAVRLHRLAEASSTTFLSREMFQVPGKPSLSKKSQD